MDSGISREDEAEINSIKDGESITNDTSENEEITDKVEINSIKEHETKEEEYLVSHLPDQVVYADHTKTMPYLNTLQGVLMFLDISGFTNLTEKFSMNAKNGIDQLTKTLNGYMRALVSEIITCDGDIIKFAGDAILTLWKVDSFKTMKITVGHVVKCAMNIQRKCGEYKTSVGVTLHCKIGIAAGEVTFAYLGNEEYCHYVTMGRTVESVNIAEKFCTSGDVVLSPTAWVHCSGLQVSVEVQEDGKHRKLTDFDSEALEALALSLEEYTAKRTLDCTESLSKLVYMNPAFSETKVRKAVTDSFSIDVNNTLSLYIAPPVMKKIIAGQPLDYLSEVRQVTIVFINLVLGQCTKYEIAQTLQSAFQVIYEGVKKVQGLLNKIFMFDKGATFLAIFGLPGFKHDNDCARALQCSYEIQTNLEAVPKITITSIGVTTGASYCGVVGHQHRHEYTVIGRKVNMAARLMMAYGGKVTCDNETYHHSKLHKANFITMEIRRMKGLQNIGTIREFKENKSRQHTVDAIHLQEYEFPIIGRGEEIKNFMKEIETIVNNSHASEQCSVIALNGTAGVGRSRMLDSLIVNVTQQGYRVVFCNLHMDNVKTPYYAVKQLVMDLLEFEYDTSHQERELALYHTFKDSFILDNLSLLNDFLHLKLPQSEQYAHMDAQTRTVLFHNLLYHIVHEISSKTGFIMFAIDDAQYMDVESWRFIEELGSDCHSLAVLTLKSGSKYSQHKAAESTLKSRTTKHIHVSGLESQYLLPLACQVLGVVNISEALDSILRQKSQGIPSWCEQLLYSMLNDEMISIVPWFDCKDIVNRNTLETGTNTELLGPRSIDVPDMARKKSSIIEQINIDTEKDNDTSDRKMDMLCIMNPDISIEDVRIPESIKGMIQSRIDRMDELDQVIIKSASVVGESFSRRMLKAVLPTNLSASRIQESLMRIATNSIFECGFRGGDSSQVMLHTANETKYECYCPNLATQEGITAITDCQLLRFKSASIQETAYEMYTEVLRRNLHVKAANFLESQAHKCTACGGGDFVQKAEPSVKKTKTGQKGDKSVRFNAKAGESNKKSRTNRTSTLSKLRQSNLRKTAPDIVIDTIPSTSRHSTVTSLEATSIRSSLFSRQELKDFDQTIRIRIRSSICEESEAGDVPNAIVNMDIRECKCTEVLLSVLPQLLKHWKSAGNLKKTVKFLMESAAAAIGTDDNMQALAYLSEVTHIVQCVKDGDDPFDGEVSQVEAFTLDTYTEAHAESLIGQALYHMGLLDETIPHFQKALSLLGCSQPKTRTGIFLKMISEGYRQWKHHKHPERYIGCANPLLASNLIEQARCLSHIYHDFQHCHKDRQALIAVLQQINKAEEANIDTHELIIAYTCMMEYCQNKCWHNLANMYETKAQHRALDNLYLTVHDHISMAHLLDASLNMKLAFGHINESIESGYTANKVIRKIHDEDNHIHMLPILTQGLILANRISDAVEVLGELEYLDNCTDPIVGKAWYYACCVDLLLETGIQLESFTTCIKFTNTYVDDPIFNVDKLPIFYLTACVALWYQRRRQDQLAATWQEKAKSLDPQLSMPSFVFVNSKLKLTECSIIRQARSLSAKKPVLEIVPVDLRKEIRQDMKFYKKVYKKIPVLQARVKHMHSCRKAITNYSKALKTLRRLYKVSSKQENITETLWIKENIEAWSQKEASQNQFWKSDDCHTQGIDWHVPLCEAKSTKYIFPLPKWK